MQFNHLTTTVVQDEPINHPLLYICGVLCLLRHSRVLSKPAKSVMSFQNVTEKFEFASNRLARENYRELQEKRIRSARERTCDIQRMEQLYLYIDSKTIDMNHGNKMWVVSLLGLSY